MTTQLTMARIYLSESDRARSHSIMKTILERLREQHQVHGVTVFRGIAGFGASGEMHATDLLILSMDLPLVIEFFDAAETVTDALSWIRELVPAEHIIYWPVQSAAANSGSAEE